MDKDILQIAPIWFITFLFSTTLHEAAHAYMSRYLGDYTADKCGLTTLHPLAHIQREPIGMILMPLMSLFTRGSIMGWGSCPIDPVWSINYPKKAALVALAGPLANLFLAIVSLIALKTLWAFGIIEPTFGGNYLLFSGESSLSYMLGAFFSILFSLNVILFIFNLMPFPPLDGFTVVTMLLPEKYAIKCFDFRSTSQASIIGLLIAFNFSGKFIAPGFRYALGLLMG